MPLKRPGGTEGLSPLPAVGTCPGPTRQLPNSLQFYQRRPPSLQEEILPSRGSDTTDPPSEIKTGLFPAPSGRLLISHPVALDISSRLFPKTSAYNGTVLGESEGRGWVELRSWPFTIFPR